MAITKLNSQAIPPNTIVESDLSYPLTNFSSTGIDDNATSTAVTISSTSKATIDNFSQEAGLVLRRDTTGATAGAGLVLGTNLNNEGVVLYGIADGSLLIARTTDITSDNPSGSGFGELLRLDNDGLKFGSDTAAANALDDYEEGTWTPVVGSTSTATSATYSHQYGYYTKVGNRVFFNMYLAFNITAQGSGNFYVTLPFNVANGFTYAAQSIAYQNIFSPPAGYHLGGYAEQNSNLIYFTFNNSVQSAPAVASGRVLMVAGHYHV